MRIAVPFNCGIPAASPGPALTCRRLGDHRMGEDKIERLRGDDVGLDLRQHLPFADLFERLFNRHLCPLGDPSDPLEQVLASGLEVFQFRDAA